MITRRRTLAAIAAAIAAPFASRTATAATHPGPKPPPKPRPPMPADYILTRRRDLYMDIPLINPSIPATVPDPTAITGCKLTVLNAYGGSNMLADVSLGSGITVALGVDDSGNPACVATAHWTPAQSIAFGDLTNQVTCVATLNVQAGGIITGPEQPFIILLMPGSTVGV